MSRKRGLEEKTRISGNGDGKVNVGVNMTKRLCPEVQERHDKGMEQKKSRTKQSQGGIQAHQKDRNPIQQTTQRSKTAPVGKGSYRLSASPKGGEERERRFGGNDNVPLPEPKKTGRKGDRECGGDHMRFRGD